MRLLDFLAVAVAYLKKSFLSFQNAQGIGKADLVIQLNIPVFLFLFIHLPLSSVALFYFPSPLLSLSISPHLFLLHSHLSFSPFCFACSCSSNQPQAVPLTQRLFSHSLPPSLSASFLALPILRSHPPLRFPTFTLYSQWINFIPSPLLHSLSRASLEWIHSS